MVFLSSTHSATYQRRRKKHAKNMRRSSRKSTFVQSTETKIATPIRAGADHSVIPSAGVVNSTSQCHRKESPKYTGTLVKGISTLHKSNAVPVISNEEMISHANMRR